MGVAKCGSSNLVTRTLSGVLRVDMEMAWLDRGVDSVIEELEELFTEIEESKQKIKDTKEDIKEKRNERESLEEQVYALDMCYPNAGDDALSGSLCAAVILENGISVVDGDIRGLRGDIERQREEWSTKVEAFLDVMDRNISEWFENPAQANRKNPFFNYVTTARAFECFAAAFIEWIEKISPIESIRVELTGGANDKGVDCKLMKDERLEAVIQVKCGKQFRNGKGNSIVLELAGSCLYYNVGKGIVVSSGKRAQFTENTKDIVTKLRGDQQKYKVEISVYFFDDILKELCDGIKDDDILPFDDSCVVSVFKDFQRRLEEL